VRRKITITLPKPEPDPPDGKCPLCGDIVTGWQMSIDKLSLCINCQRAGPRGPHPKFKHQFSTVPHIGSRSVYGVSMRTASVVLYLLEKESGSAKHS